MKICFIGLRGIPGVSGGIETHCENMCERMARNRPDLDIVVFGRKPFIGNSRYQSSAGITVVPAFAANNKYLETISNTFVSILRARFSERADCVHIHAIGPALLAPMARLLGLSVVLTHHGDDFRRQKWNRLAKAVLRLGERVGISSAERVIAVSPSLTDRLKRDYPSCADRVQYIPNGADHITAYSMATTSEAILPRFGLTEHRYIVSVGRLVPEKGFADLIRAHKASRSKLPLVIVGGKSNSDHDRELADLAHDGVIMTDTLPQADVAHLLAKARLFVLASHHEGLPIAALEAWAMGAPLLLSDIQPNRDLGMPGAHYFPVGDVDTLAARLANDAVDIPTIELPDAFNWTSIAMRTAQVYGSLYDESVPEPVQE